MNQENSQQKREIKIKITDDIMRGAYANFMKVSHAKGEFVLDFANIVPPTGIITARIITSPGHLKRIIGALEYNFKKYEEKFGKIVEAEEPKEKEIGFHV